MSKLDNLKPFQPGNPGRPKGSRNKLGEAFIEALHEDFLEHGPSTIARVRIQDPTAYVKVCASLLPKEVRIENASDLSDSELDQRIRQLAGLLDLTFGSETRVNGVADGETAPDRPH